MTPDTDIFVFLMYNLKNTWKDVGLYLLKKGQIIMPQKPQKELYPLHLLISKLDPKVIGQLPAGCDTVAKVETKIELIHILNSFAPLITGFGREALDDDMLKQAGQFLINEVTKKYQSCTLSTKQQKIC